ncbi:hypothetical protein [Nannocystis pusilla]|uniref:hypothetical protein n=1 Tax=Nannocystis pusilla TaxID=889268 RepID=UPI003B79E9C1
MPTSGIAPRSNFAAPVVVAGPVLVLDASVVVGSVVSPALVEVPVPSSLVPVVASPVVVVPGGAVVGPGCW